MKPVSENLRRAVYFSLRWRVISAYKHNYYRVVRAARLPVGNMMVMIVDDLRNV